MDVTPIHDVGDGYSTFTGSASPSVVDIVSSKGGPASIDATITVCTTTDEVYQALNIDASAKLSSTWGSFSDRLTFAHKITHNTRTINILVTASKQTETHTVTSVKFKNAFSDAATLYNQGGDSYVSSITLGASYMAAYTFVAHDDSSYTKLTNSVDASIDGVVTSFKASLETACEDIAKSSTVNWTFSQQGVGFANSDLPDQEHLEPWALNFGKLPVGDQAAIVAFQIRSYSHVAGCPSFKPITHNLKLYLGGVGGHGYAEVETAAQANLPIVQDAFNTYARYGMLSSDPQLQAHIDTLNATITSIDTWRQAIDDDPTSTAVAPPDTSASLDVPTTNTLMEVGPWLGGPHADFTTNDPQANWIVHGIIPRSLQISYAQNTNMNIESVMRSYAGTDNKDIANFPKTDGSLGQPDDTLFLTKDNRLTGCEIVWQDGDDMSVIWAVNTTTTQGGNKLWNKQSVSGQPNIHASSWTCPANAAFLGWNVQGKNSLVTAWQPVYEAFQPCNWGPANSNVASLAAFRDEHFKDDSGNL